MCQRVWVVERGACWSERPKEGEDASTGMCNVRVLWPCGWSVTGIGVWKDVRGRARETCLCAPESKGNSPASAVAYFLSEEIGI